MNEPWFDTTYLGFFGAVLGTLGGVWGGLCGWLLPRGRAKRFIWTTYWLFMATGLASLAGGLAALAAGQPRDVLLALIVPGVQTSLLFGCLGYFVIRPGFRAVELRKMQAEDLA